MSSLKTFFFVVVVSAPMGLVPCIASAEARTGFLLRLNTGFGYTHVSREVGGVHGEEHTKGASAVGQLAIGGFVAPNIALHATFFSQQMFNPIHHNDGGDVDDGDADVVVRSGGFGGGFTYYFTPAELLFSASIGFGRLETESRSGNLTQREEGEIGLASSVLLAKEWPVSEHWSLGVGLQFDYAQLPALSTSRCVRACDDHATSMGGGGVFSASYH